MKRDRRAEELYASARNFRRYPRFIRRRYWPVGYQRLLPPLSREQALLAPLTSPLVRLRLEFFAGWIALIAILAIPVTDEGFLSWFLQIRQLLPGLPSLLRSAQLPAGFTALISDVHRGLIFTALAASVVMVAWAGGLQLLEMLLKRFFDPATGELQYRRSFAIAAGASVFFTIWVVTRFFPTSTAANIDLLFSRTSELQGAFAVGFYVPPMLPVLMLLALRTRARVPDKVTCRYLLRRAWACRYDLPLYLLVFYMVAWGTFFFSLIAPQAIRAAPQVVVAARSGPGVWAVGISLMVALLFHAFVTSRLGAWTRRVVEERARSHVLTPHLVSNLMGPLATLVAEDRTSAIAAINGIRQYASRVALVGHEKADSWTLAEEFEAVGEYAAITCLRFPFSFKAVLPPTLQSASCPVLLLQPLVENVVNHGVRPRVGDGLPEVECRVVAVHEGGWCRIVVAMEAPQWRQPAAPSSAGMGVGRALVKQRVQAIGFPTKGTFDDGPTPTGWSTTIRFRLPRNA